MEVHNILNWIILIGGVVAAIFGTIHHFSKPGRFFQRKKEERLKERIREVLQEELNDSLKDYDPKFDHLEELITGNKKDTDEQLGTIIQGTKDVLRQKIMTIYRANRKNMTVSIYDREALDELYKDYKAQGGNNYIDKYYHRSLSWHTLRDSEEEGDE